MHDGVIGELFDEATRLAASLLFGKAGLNNWPWYRESRPRMEEEIGRSEMLHEARQELMRLLAEGVGPLAAFRETEAYLRGLWRPRYDRHKATYVPELLPLDERLVSGHVRRDEERTHEILVVIRSELTEDEWELVCAYADTGSLRRAGDRCGVSHEQVRRAVQAARRVQL